MAHSAGDILTNLRKVLDYLVFQLALHHTHGKIDKPGAPQFPIVGDPKNWPEAVKRRLKEVDPAHIALIEGFQPYHRFHEELAVGLYFHPFQMLRDLSDPDKHRLPTIVMVPGSGVQGGPAGLLFTAGVLQQAIRFQMPDFDHRIELGAVLVRVRAPVGAFQADMDVAGYVLPQVAFSDGRPVIAVIDKIAAAIAIVLRKFEPLI